MSDKDENEYLKKQEERFRQLSMEAEKNGEDFKKVVVKGMKYKQLEPDYENWLKECLNSSNWNGLNDLIFQMNRYDLLPACPSGYDHCWLFPSMLGAFACGEISAIERMFPHELGLTANGYPFYVVASNLLISLWYNIREHNEPSGCEADIRRMCENHDGAKRNHGNNKDEVMLTQALSKAEKFVTTKKPQWERATVAYLLALHNKDVAEAQTQLQEVCRSYMRSDMSPAKKMLCVEAHGLYCLAYYLLPKEQYQQLQMPDYKNFSIEYASWRREHPEPELHLYFEYPASMELVNQIYLAPVAITKIHQPYLGQDNPYMSAREKKQWNLDLEAMLDDFVAGMTGEK